MSSCNRKVHQRGVTLIEMMVVVVIVAILAAIAYPSYLEQVRAGRRADAMGVLFLNANYMGRSFVQNNTYVGADTALPYSQFPIDGGTPSYNFSAIAATATFLLRAVAIDGDPSCGTLTLDQNYTKGKVGGSWAWDRCWKDN